jgi:hypothetical protein
MGIGGSSKKQKKQKGLGINYIINKNHGLITLP